VNEGAAQVVPVSVATDGTPTDNNSFLPAMSATGRFVAFTSFASNLVPGDSNGVQDVFLRDRDTDADGVFDEAGAVSTVRVSQRGAVQGVGGSNEAAITPDGRYVVFSSFAANLFSTGQAPLPTSVILRWDRLSGDIVLISQTTEGEPLLGVRSVSPDISDDGNQVVFVHGGSLPAEVEAGFGGIVYRRDVAAGTLTQISNALNPPAPPNTARTTWPSISGDGTKIAFAVETLRDGGPRQSGVMYVVDALTTAVLFHRGGVQPRLSRDGAFLAFIDAQGANSGGPAIHIHLASGERRAVGFFGIDSANVSTSPSGRYYKVSNQLVDFDFGAELNTGGAEAAFDAGDTSIAYTSATGNPKSDILAGPLSIVLDADGDGLNDHWEGQMGLSPSSATGINGAAGDPDNDGLTNAEEFARGSHPRGTDARFLAEGASGTFFTTRYAIANPNAGPATVALRLELAGGGSVRRTVWVAPGRTVTFDSRALGLGTASFSAVVESDRPVVVDRLMMWGDALGIPYGSHAETSSAAPSTSWLLAEGSTVLDFQLFYLLQNPQTTPTTATVRYLLPSGAPVVRTYGLPAQSRTTIYVNTVPGLESTDVSAEITATQPIAVERAMYRSAPGQPFALGHAAAAVTAPSTSWFFGEGATGAFFDTYLLLANPSPQPASVQVDYLRDGEGAISLTYAVPANSRFSVYVDGEPGMAATAFGTRVTSSVPIVAERAMYWAGGFFDYYEGHDSAGATQTGSHWVLAGGEEVGPRVAYTFVLIANTAAVPVTVRVSTLPETGASTSSDPIDIPAHSRVTYPLPAGVDFLGGVEVSEVVQQGGTPTGALVVEGSLYWNAGGRLFGAGANWPATRIP
jgi:Tol biopolymer transport system component